ncbi:MAG: nucleotide sugar dehydrogenase [Planctomycetota bacterium]|nr:MAG: nucleotide sugar dehydrogenase [Planctomycetota bacterium]
MRRGEAKELPDRVADRSAAVAVLGLGYVGLPLALTAAEKGFRTVGFDVSRRRVEELLSGRMGVKTAGEERLRKALESGLFRPTWEEAELREADVFVICVPTPLDRYRRPDLGYVRSAGEAAARALRPGVLVSLESTTYPGTTEEVLVPLLEKTGLVAGEDFEVCYSPEREDPGNPRYSTSNIPKVVGADTERGRRWATAFYSALVSEVVPVSSCKAAEATKILENVYRAVNISLVNELKVIYERMGIDIWEVIRAAATKPFGFQAFYPGPGMGGHCVPVDPFYLSHKAKSIGVSARFIELAGKINRDMPGYVVERLGEALAERGKELRGSRVLVLGLAYKPDVPDTRESPALAVMRKLKRLGARVEYYDPLVPEMPEEGGLRSPRRSVESVEGAGPFDAGILVTAHSSFDYEALYRALPLIVDTRNAFGRLGDPEGKVVKA